MRRQRKSGGNRYKGDIIDGIAYHYIIVSKDGKKIWKKPYITLYEAQTEFNTLDPLIWELQTKENQYQHTGGKEKGEFEDWSKEIDDF